MYLHWVKSHVGIPGNEIADKAAILAHVNDRSELNEIISVLKKKFRYYWNDYWKVSSDISRKGLFLRSIRDDIDGGGPIAKFKLRKDETIFHKMRIGHVPLNSYLNRFNLSSSDQCQYCNSSETLEHYLLHCTNYQNLRNQMKLELLKINVNQTDLKTLLAGNERYRSKRNDIMNITIDYVRKTKRFN